MSDDERDPIGEWVNSIPERGLLYRYIAQWLGTALVMQVVVVVMASEDVSSGYVLLVMNMFAAMLGGAYARHLRLDAGTGALSVTWMPVLFSVRHWYWSLDLPSLGGPGQEFMKAVFRVDSPVGVGVAVLMGGAGLFGWLVAHWAKSGGKKRR